MFAFSSPFYDYQEGVPRVRNLVRVYKTLFKIPSPGPVMSATPVPRSSVLRAGQGSPRPPQAPFVGEELPSSARNLRGPRGARSYPCGSVHGSTCARRLHARGGKRASGKQQRPSPDCRPRTTRVAELRKGLFVQMRRGQRGPLPRTQHGPPTSEAPGPSRLRGSRARGGLWESRTLQRPEGDSPRREDDPAAADT